MSESIFSAGTDVIVGRERGTVIDVRATPAGKWVFGVETAEGEVRYFTEKALRLPEG
ncbi:hypothetical protein [Microbacterium sp. CBA3102]|uniref:hypothetical protein n=1 Tax=Microbacterium sp. CBA3102 TaxID=2603598 RepID=UPI0018831EA0|nr:hypothetical protein [Microbacterium sp. CBA3102]